MPKDWIVTGWSLTDEAKKYGERAPYQHNVTGWNVCGRKIEPFWWTIPNLFKGPDSHRYDLTNAVEAADFAALCALQPKPSDMPPPPEQSRPMFSGDGEGTL